MQSFLVLTFTVLCCPSRENLFIASGKNTSVLLKQLRPILLDYLASVTMHIFSETTLWVSHFSSKIYFHLCTPILVDISEAAALECPCYKSGAMALNETILLPRAHMALPRGATDCHNLGEGRGTNVWWERARDVAKPTASQRIVPSSPHTALANEGALCLKHPWCEG